MKLIEKIKKYQNLIIIYDDHIKKVQIKIFVNNMQEKLKHG